MLVGFVIFYFSLIFLSQIIKIVGKAQIIGAIFFTEIVTEAQKPHYTKGGPFPTVVFPPINFPPADSAALKQKQDSELNNGRLAMIAIMSFIAEANIPGSVPLLAGNPAF
jgi:hypothetical protein